MYCVYEEKTKVRTKFDSMKVTARSAEQGCQIFLDNVPKRGKCILNCRNEFQMAKEHHNHFHSKALQNLPKLEFLVRKYPIWQPCRRRLAPSFTRHDLSSHFPRNVFAKVPVVIKRLPCAYTVASHLNAS
jgi:hypothetical protein